MKRISLFIAMLMATTAIMLAQKVQKGTYWHDGFAFYHANAIDRDGTIHFVGGTLHEGGYQFALKPTATLGEYKLALNEPGNEYSQTIDFDLKPGNKVTLTTVAGTQVLSFFNGTGTLESVVYKFDGDLEQVMIDDWRTAFAGTYVDHAGKKCIFTPDGRCQLPGENSLKPYTVEEMYEMPSDIITTASGKQFQVHITAKGIELWSGIYDNDENFTPDDNVLALTRTASPYGDGCWAWASTQLITQSLAGCHKAEVLRLIRNEIWARHGYRFSSPDLQQYFSAQPWYRPVADNASIQLSDVEKLNVDLLKAIETDIRKQQ